jgi:predicted TIM-barrel fold metal-dependent hydrolase
VAWSTSEAAIVPIDTHVHVVSPNRDRYPVLENSPAWPAVTGNGLIAEMEAQGIEREMLVQRSILSYRFDNSYAIDCAAAHPDRFQVVCDRPDRT